MLLLRSLDSQFASIAEISEQLPSRGPIEKHLATTNIHLADSEISLSSLRI